MEEFLSYVTQTSYKSAELYAVKPQKKAKALPEPYAVILKYFDPVPLSDAERELVNTIVSNCPGVYFKPRKKAKTIIIGEPEKWQALGFETEREYLSRFELQRDTTHFNGYELQLAVFGEEINE